MGKYPPPAPPYVGPPDKHSGLGNMPVSRIVLHGTVSAPEEGGARDIARYFRSDSAGGSAHYIVDPGVIVQSCYDSWVAWHAPPNAHSLGVEFCDWVGVGGQPLPVERWLDDAHRPMLRMGARLVAELCCAYDVPPRMIGKNALRAGVRGVCEHSDISQAFGQSSHWDLGEFPRRRFIKMVRREVRAIRAGSPTGEPITPQSTARTGGGKLTPTLLDRATRRARARRQDRTRDPKTFHLPGQR